MKLFMSDRDTIRGAQIQAGAIHIMCYPYNESAYHQLSNLVRVNFNDMFIIQGKMHKLKCHKLKLQLFVDTSCFHSAMPFCLITFIKKGVVFQLQNYFCVFSFFEHRIGQFWLDCCLP